jgi:mono/diheme cytochrome c family protein
MKKIISLLSIFTLFFSLSTILAQEAWTVPPGEKERANPFVDDEATLSVGKSLYNKHCKQCHGKEGLGDGPAAGKLSTTIPDLTSKIISVQSDGELFFKMSKGRAEMPGFEKTISDAEDRWLVINYLRTLMAE